MAGAGIMDRIWWRFVSEHGHFMELAYNYSDKVGVSVTIDRVENLVYAYRLVPSNRHCYGGEEIPGHQSSSVALGDQVNSDVIAALWLGFGIDKIRVRSHLVYDFLLNLASEQPITMPT